MQNKIIIWNYFLLGATVLLGVYCLIDAAQSLFFNQNGLTDLLLVLSLMNIVLAVASFALAYRMFRNLTKTRTSGKDDL